MNEEAQDFERWLREKLRGYIMGERLDESKIVEADPPKDDHVPDANKLIQDPQDRLGGVRRDPLDPKKH